MVDFRLSADSGESLSNSRDHSEPISQRSPIAPGDLGAWTSFWTLAGILGLFLVLRVPSAYLQPGGQDEDYYAVPGLAVLESGLPRLPTLPARNPESVFYQADVALFAEPPLYFYWQALFYAVLPDLYGTGRLASAVAGLAALAALFGIGRSVTGRNDVGLMAAMLLSVSRWFYFGATTARPDQLSGTFGLLAVAALLASRHRHRERWLAVSGICIGCGGLTHFLAITYAVPLGLWAVMNEATWRRRGASFTRITLPAMSVALCWVPFIATYPEPFRKQFHNQFVAGTGDSLLMRLVWPWEALRFQGAGMVQHIGWPQTMLTCGALLFCWAYSWRRRQSDWLGVIGTAGLSSYLLCVCLADDHLGLGYWTVPAGLAYLCAASLPIRMAHWAGRSQWSQGMVVAVVFGGLCLAHLPGCGLRTLIVLWQHRHDVRYHAPQFAQEIMRSIPPDARCSVDAQFLLDFYVSGRPTLNLQSMPKYFLTQEHPFDYMIVSRFGVAEKTAELVDAELIQTLGLRDDPFACYAEIYRPRSRTQALDPKDP